MQDVLVLDGEDMLMNLRLNTSVSYRQVGAGVLLVPSVNKSLFRCKLVDTRHVSSDL